MGELSHVTGCVERQWTCKGMSTAVASYLLYQKLNCFGDGVSFSSPSISYNTAFPSFHGIDHHHCYQTIIRFKNDFHGCSSTWRQRSQQQQTTTNRQHHK